MTAWLRSLAAALLALLLAAPASAQPSLASGSVAEAAAKLRPGEFLWAPHLAPSGPVLVIINRKNQRLVAYRNGVPIGISTVSTGRPGHSTPTGLFTVLQKQVEHYSSLYDDAPMPYMQRLTWEGVALHGGQLPGYPASHGCIRLPTEFAKLLYGVTRLGMTVLITDSARLPAVAPEPDLLRAGKPAPFADGAGAEWHPDRSPAGPVSILISASDHRLLVLRNGIVIGSSPVEIDGAVARPEAYVLQSVDAAGRHWQRLPLPGQAADAPVPAQAPQRFRVPDSFRSQAATAVGIGTTVVITPDAVGAREAPVTLLDSQPTPRR